MLRKWGFGHFADLRRGLGKKEGVVFLRGGGLIPRCTLCKNWPIITKDFRLSLFNSFTFYWKQTGNNIHNCSLLQGNKICSKHSFNLVWIYIKLNLENFKFFLDFVMLQMHHNLLNLLNCICRSIKKVSYCILHHCFQLLIQFENKILLSSTVLPLLWRVLSVFMCFYP